MARIERLILFLLIFGAFWFFGPKAQAASLIVGPTAGTFTVGSTFDVSIFLNTDNQVINALEVFLSFPPDKLQLVSPTAGKSVVSIWTSQPRFNNATGRVDLQGGVPGGVNVSSGLVTTLTFRVKSVGSAIIKFLDNSKVLLNDGLGTDALGQTQNGVYNLILPPPAGPTVVSETHPEQGRWYSNPSVFLSWALDSGANGYSYILNQEPINIPDDIAEGVKTSVVYKTVADGAHYFHIKALREGSWGGTTHFAINIDMTPPAEFPIQIIPGVRTTRRQPIIQFATTDAKSGLDHYELKIVPLGVAQAIERDSDQPLFIETDSPYVTPELPKGAYDIIVRAYDKAGNYQESSERLKIVSALFTFVKDKGLEVRSIVIIPWLGVWIVLGILIALLGLAAFFIKKWHYLHHVRFINRELPPPLRKGLEELKSYRAKYGKNLLILIAFFSLIGFFGGGKLTLAQTTELSPPLITSLSRNLSAEEIFYAGGKTDVGNATVILYIQNLQTGETESYNIQSDNKGDWFYRHSGFLSTGNYLLWAQTRLADAASPPSPQTQMVVRRTALQFGASRLSYEALYFLLTILLTLIAFILFAYIIIHGRRGRAKQAAFLKETMEVEDALRHGFALLRRDIGAELALIKKAKLNKVISLEERQKEEELLKDLEVVEARIGREILDVERLGL